MTGVIVGSVYYNTVKALKLKGIRCIDAAFSASLPEYIRYHADMNIFHYWNNEAVLTGKTAGEGQGLFFSSLSYESTGSEYPDDCRLNAVRIDNKLICNPASVSDKILKKAESDGLIIIPVKQGYTKCSVCVVDAGSIITDDESIYKSAANYFDDILYVQKGSIRLSGMNYGFIGGCTGKLGKNKLAFNGRIESHTDSNKIIDFLDKHKIEAVELTDDTLEDIGSIIPVTEIY